MKCHCYKFMQRDSKYCSISYKGVLGIAVKHNRMRHKTGKTKNYNTMLLALKMDVLSTAIRCVCSKKSISNTWSIIENIVERKSNSKWMLAKDYGKGFVLSWIFLHLYWYGWDNKRNAKVKETDKEFLTIV